MPIHCGVLSRMCEHNDQHVNSRFIAARLKYEVITNPNSSVVEPARRVSPFLAFTRTAPANA